MKFDEKVEEILNEKENWSKKIDKMTATELLDLQRNAPSGHSVFSDDKLYKQFQKRLKKLGGITPSLSKSVGWSLKEDFSDDLEKSALRYKEKGICKEKLDLPDGEYGCMHYGYTLEINEEKYDTFDGCKCTRKHCGGPKPINIKDGIAKWPKID